MTAAPLTVHNAQITTASVQIQTLTISGKQVTLAVYRQLIEEPWWSEVEEGEEGDHPIWGRVNYCPTKACQHCDGCRTSPWGACSAKHQHIIWQKGAELRRATVWQPCREDDPDSREWKKKDYRIVMSKPQLFIAV